MTITSFDDLTVRQADIKEFRPLLERDHYITRETGTFRSSFAVGAFHEGICHAVCTFASPSVAEAIQGAFGLPKGQFEGIFELTRFCISDELRGVVKNAGSWFMARSLKALRKDRPVRAIITYADSSLHDGGLYRASNFIYCGMAAQKSDFWFLQPDGTYKKHSRGPMKGKAGEWRPRTRKHRYVIVYDKTLTLLWPQVQFVPSE